MNCAPEKYHMQDNAYFYRFDDLSLEFIAVDTNKVDCPHGIGGDGKSSYFAQCGGEGPACGFLGKVMDASKALLEERRRESTAESIYVIQHYDGQCQSFVFPNLGRPPKAKDIKCAHGHTHQ